MRYQLDFYTSYGQFYLYDKDSSGKTDSENFLTDDAFNKRLAIEDGILGVLTECYGAVKGELNLLSSPNSSYDPNMYDHIVEGSIVIRSGTLQVLDCPNSNVELEVSIQPGIYRVRVYSSNLSSVDGDEGDDYYIIELWNANFDERKVLKQYFN